MPTEPAGRSARREPSGQLRPALERARRAQVRSEPAARAAAGAAGDRGAARRRRRARRAGEDRRRGGHRRQNLQRGGCGLGVAAPGLSGVCSIAYAVRL
ncbi:MAG: hypothetical protein E6H63_14480 [Betaproteobacteria bacterium]|nr:MAG: hypothetical protein E6H63_14480 [Betaproteobacteria bacterium]TMH41325.1 MAG: hypothetical protein E6H54_16525 [Betaproteobacteria bacterium]